MTLTEKICRNIKEARLLKGLTQKEVAQKLYMSQQQYYRFESGKFELNYNQIYQLCKILDMTPNEFFEYDERDEKIELE